MPDVYDEILGEEDRIPTDGETAKLRALCLELAQARETKQELEEQLKRTNSRIWDLEMRDIPDLATELGVDRLGLPEYESDISVAPYYKANISGDWPEERREESFFYLEQVGLGDIIRREVTLSLGRDSEEKIEEILEALSEISGIPPASVRRNVPWNTLTSVLREQTEKGVAVDLEKIGGVVGQKATIKQRKK